MQNAAWQAKLWKETQRVLILDSRLLLNPDKVHRERFPSLPLAVVERLQKTDFPARPTDGVVIGIPRQIAQRLDLRKQIFISVVTIQIPVNQNIFAAAPPVEDEQLQRSRQLFRMNIQPKRPSRNAACRYAEGDHPVRD